MSSVTVMVERNVRLSSRNFEALLTSVMLPILILVLFVYLFGGAIQTGTAEYVDYALPGVLLLCTGFVSALTATRVSEDLQQGIVDRFRSLDVGGAAILGGHVAGSMLRNAVSVTLLIAAALLIGFRPSATPLEWLAVIGVLALFIFAISWAAAVFGLLAKTPEGAAGFQFFVMFLPYPSSAFVPVETMPTWLHGFAENQPATPVIETVRGLLMGTPIGASAALAVAWCVGISVTAIVVAALLFRRRVG
ncbi:ABC transporter permease [Hoyosella altamirensis]|uniref:Transport permease protein n=1 Tax=Hoyosella altamirensis TaxID=616997 RepID=A0A839RTK8_9ACTN|nr:ABC transporter permease [Hoyosella altamirensis]MBB3039404.1 ABC-2 type transport system permease protein [Hoyosella altamirensis]